MKILILGGTGMLGHKLWQVFSQEMETWVAVRSNNSISGNMFDPSKVIVGVVAQDFDSVLRALRVVKPDVVVNCIGIIKQHQIAQDPVISIAINALFPHRLAEVCKVADIRLLHISTDCVFSGRKGHYVETDISDAEDLYGRTKYLGEVDGPGCLTLRTSIIGPELGTRYGLLEWFLAQSGKSVYGYNQAIFSGVTTHVLAHLMLSLIIQHPGLDGLWHVAAQPIDKFSLLSLVKAVYGVNIQIEPEDKVRIDRSLNGERFTHAIGFIAPSWQTMITEMYADAIATERQ